MIIAIASGKGGTGKTTVAVNLALALTLSRDKDLRKGNVQLLDCDVEEPNAHIFLQPKIEEEKPVYVKVPLIDTQKCDYCGDCAQFCAFNALFVVKADAERGIKGKVLLFPEQCHGCGGCTIVCSRDAITEKNRVVGVVKKAKAGESGGGRGIDLVFGELNIGESMPVPVVKAVKCEIADEKTKTVIIDCPPGTSCPVIHAVYGSDYCILVAEPTPFGLHDMKISVEVLRELKIPFGVIINRAGIGNEKVYEYCEEEGIAVLLEIPHDRRIAQLYSRGIPFVGKIEGWKDKFWDLVEHINSEHPNF